MINQFISIKGTYKINDHNCHCFIITISIIMISLDV